jgi:hypothetical protein
VTTVAGGAAQAVTGREELGPMLGLATGDEAGVEELRADQLVVAMGGGNKTLAGHAAAAPSARCRAIGERAAAEDRLAGTVHLVGKAGAFRPDAGIDDADDDVFTLDQVGARHLGPEAAGRAQAQKVRSRECGRLACFVDLHVTHQRAGQQGLDFGFGQHGGKAV